MTKPAHEPAILQGARRVRYLKLIALFKIAKGLLLLILGISMLFLNARTRWMGALSNWIADEILLEHTKGLPFFSTNCKRCLPAARSGPQVFWPFLFSSSFH